MLNVPINKKKTVTCFPWEVYSSGTELSPSLSLSFPYQFTPGRERKRGGNVGELPVNRLVGSRP